VDFLRTDLRSDFIKANLEEIRVRMDRSCLDADRDHRDVELVCVSKNFGPEAIEVVLKAGHRVFGENRVQEAQEKWPGLRSNYGELDLHLIGPLQSNKAAEAVRLFDVIETVDRPKIARAIAQAMRASGRNPRLYIQVNTGEEPQKAGVAPYDLRAFLELCRGELDLPIEGLMCIPPLDQLASPHFALLGRLASEFGLRKLSMGMSADFELAIQLGATTVRVGSAIFGMRLGGTN
jgi:pyridoxal phosphate enzyme (YggS family)